MTASRGNNVVVNGPLELRRATDADALEVATVHVGSWQVAYQGIFSSEFLNGLDVNSRAGRYTFGARQAGDPVTWLAREGSGVVGFVTVGQSRDDDGAGVGEVAALYVAPNRWRSGVGSLLLDEGGRLLTEMGFHDASLWVLEANTRGRRFYEARGWHQDGRTSLLTIGGTEVTEVRYRKALGYHEDNGKDQ